MNEQEPTKKCAKCKDIKSTSEFYAQKHTKAGFQPICKSCEKLRRKVYVRENPEKISALNRKYYAENKEKASIRNKIYREANPEKIKLKNKRWHEKNIVAHKEYCRAYTKSDAGKAADKKKSLKRRAEKNNCKVDDFNPYDIFIRDGYICQLCGIKTRPDYKNPHHPKYPNVDHIVPLSKGGDHSKKNTQCLCHMCNSIKYNTGKGDQLRLFG